MSLHNIYFIVIHVLFLNISKRRERVFHCVKSWILSTLPWQCLLQNLYHPHKCPVWIPIHLLLTVWICVCTMRIHAATKNCNLHPPLYCIRYRHIDMVSDGGNLQWYPANIFVHFGWPYCLDFGIYNLLCKYMDGDMYHDDLNTDWNPSWNIKIMHIR